MTVAVYLRQRPNSVGRGDAGDGGGVDSGFVVETASHEIGYRGRDLLKVSSCPRCGATDHGVPSLVFTRAESAVGCHPTLPHVSLSRTPEIEAVAFSVNPIIGIDIESTSRVEHAALDDVAFHPQEHAAMARLSPAARALRRTMLWAAKESVLKAAGTGLAVAPELLLCEVSDTDTRVSLSSWPPTLGFAQAPEITVTRIGREHVCAVAHSPGAVTTFSWWPIGAKEPS